MRHVLRRMMPLSFFVAVLMSTTVYAGPLFSDDDAVQLHGQFRTLYDYSREPDADASVAPGRVHQVSTRLRLQPTLWLNEFVSIESMVDADGLWGENQDAYNFSGQATGVRFTVGRAALHWQTPVGKISVGRVGWNWGLGLFDNDGRSDPDRYGVAQATGAQDMLRVRLAPLGLNKPLVTTLFMRQFAGSDVGSPFRDRNGWSLGGAAEGTFDFGNIGALMRVDRFRRGSSNFLWADTYAQARLGVFGIAYEAALRWGRSQKEVLIDSTGLQTAATKTKRLAAGGVIRMLLTGVHKGKVSFETTGLEAGVLSGDDPAKVLTQTRWQRLSINPEYHVGLLLLQRLWPARRNALAAAAVARTLGRLPGQQAGLNDTYNERISNGAGNLWYLFPGLGLRTDDDLRFRLNILYARSIVAEQTLFVLDTNGTTQTIDDTLRSERNQGFEFDTHISYPMWGGVRLVLEAGVALPQNIYRNAADKRAPTAFTVQPRLTVDF